MEVMEIEGKTIDEAIENACSAFQVSREKLNIEIISEGSSGFLGIGAKKAQIRASLLAIDRMLDAPFTQPASSNRKPTKRRFRCRNRRRKERLQGYRRSQDRTTTPPTPAVRPAFAVTGGDGEPAKKKRRGFSKVS